MKNYVAFTCLAAALSSSCGPAKKEEPPAPWEAENPIKRLPAPPLGITSTWAELETPPTPERVRLGRWLYYDTRLSADGTLACARCHRAENAFSEPTPVSPGINGHKGSRKAPWLINQAWTLYPHFFWDGRAASLEEQALGSIANPIEMGNTHDAMVQKISGISSYGKYFQEAFGTPGITKERVAHAIADYERTRLSGNSPWDQWKAGNESAVSDAVKLGDSLFFDKAGCNQCHFGQNFTDTRFHNLGIGWDPKTKKLADEGRYVVSKDAADKGAFKTPTLRDVSKHAPYMHDGSIPALREVVLHYDKGGNRNPWLSPKMKKLKLTEKEIDALVAMMEALNGEGYMDKAPSQFPR